MAPAVCLVSMPWQSLDMPSLPVGLLESATVAAGLPKPWAYHGNLRWAEFLMAKSGGVIGPAEYHAVAGDPAAGELGDWVFTGVLHGDPGFGVAELREYAAGRGLDMVSAMRDSATAFVELAAVEIRRMRPAVVGFTATFTQNVASLALARRLKELDPGLTIVLGGANCDGPMGVAIHRNYPFVDYVIRGEGERAFPALLIALADGSPLGLVPGLCWREPDGTQHRNPAPASVPPRDDLTPDYGDWLDRVQRSTVIAHIEPKLATLAARCAAPDSVAVTGPGQR